MRKVIDGRRYDTEKATLVYCHTNHNDTSNFGYRARTLYLTSNGAWFIHHEGGALTDMAEYRDGHAFWGEDIEPVNADDAYGFLEAHSDDEEAQGEIDRYFADKVQLA